MFENLAQVAKNSPFGSPFTVAKCKTQDESRSISAGELVRVFESVYYLSSSSCACVCVCACLFGMFVCISVRTSVCVSLRLFYQFLCALLKMSPTKAFSFFFIPRFLLSDQPPMTRLLARSVPLSTTPSVAWAVFCPAASRTRPSSRSISSSAESKSILPSTRALEMALRYKWWINCSGGFEDW